MNGYTETDLHAAAESGIHAPSMHNSQPWLFRLRDGAIDILADPSRHLAVADRSGWACGFSQGRQPVILRGSPRVRPLRVPIPGTHYELQSTPKWSRFA